MILEECKLKNTFEYYVKGASEPIESNIIYFREPSMYTIRDIVRDLESMFLQSVLSFNSLTDNSKNKEQEELKDEGDAKSGITKGSEIIVMLKAGRCFSEVCKKFEDLFSSGYVCYVDDEGKIPLEKRVLRNFTKKDFDYLMVVYLDFFLDYFIEFPSEEKAES